MKIVADADMLEVESSFKQLGELILVPGREIGKSHLLDADALIVRSITTVNGDLLEGTRIRFVASATSGTDHIDLDYLADNGIGFADARGSNANAVVDYCFAALAHAVIKKGLKLQSSRVGIIGAGNIGSLFASKLKQLGIAYRLCDPPLEHSRSEISGSDDGRYCSLHEALQCNVVTLHVPLSRAGDYPTHHLINSENLQYLSEEAVLINTCRGSVVDETALLDFLHQREDLSCIVDVWENEPEINEDLAERVEIATPHIAGYSRDAKFAATHQLSQAFRNHFGIACSDEPIPECVPALNVSLETDGLDSDSLHWHLINAAFPIVELSEQFKQSITNNKASKSFEQLRKNLLSRREFRYTNLKEQPLTSGQRELLSVMGFNTD